MLEIIAQVIISGALNIAVLVVDLAEQPAPDTAATSEQADRNQR